MSKYFGTDGFRGEANKILKADDAYNIGRYLGWYYSREHRGRIVVRRHIVGGANRTFFSVDLPPRLCRTGTCRRLQTE